MRIRPKGRSCFYDPAIQDGRAKQNFKIIKRVDSKAVHPTKLKAETILKEKT